MKINNATIQNSQINDGLGVDAKVELNNTGTVNTSGNGTTLVGCSITTEGLANLDGMRDAQHALLRKAQEEILHRRIEQAASLFSLLTAPALFNSLDSKDQKITIHTYCSLAESEGKSLEAESWLNTLTEPHLSSDLVRSWKAWFEHNKGGGLKKTIGAVNYLG